MESSELVDSLTVSLLSATLELTRAYALVVAFIGFWLFVAVVAASGETSEYAGAAAKASGSLALSVYLLVSLLSTKWGAGLTIIFGLPFDRAIKFHRMAGRSLVIVAGAHMLAVLDYWGSKTITSVNKVGYRSVVPLYGLWAWIFFILMGAFSAPAVRRASYELFLASHWIGYSFSSLFLLLHLAESTLAVVLILVTFLLHTADFLKKALCVFRPVPKVEAEIIGEVCVLSLHLSSSLGATAGDYAFLNIREVSLTEFHPFTISSNPNNSLSFATTFHIKDMGVGTWSHNLHRRVAANESLTVAIDGPGGALQVDPYQRERVLLAAGGIGVTPMASMMEDFLTKREISPHVHFTWVIRNVTITRPFKALLEKVAASDKFHVRIFVTKASEEEAAALQAGLPGSEVFARRPKAGEECQILDRESQNVAVYACGPSPLVADFETWAYKYDMLFHQEYFLF